MERHLRLEFAEGAELLCSRLQEASLLGDLPLWEEGTWQDIVLDPNPRSPLQGLCFLRNFR